MDEVFGYYQIGFLKPLQGGMFSEKKSLSAPYSGWWWDCHDRGARGSQEAVCFWWISTVAWRIPCSPPFGQESPREKNKEGHQNHSQATSTQACSTQGLLQMPACGGQLASWWAGVWGCHCQQQGFREVVNHAGVVCGEKNGIYVKNQSGYEVPRLAWFFSLGSICSKSRLKVFFFGGGIIKFNVDKTICFFSDLHHWHHWA